MLTLNDGRNELWQWDTGRKLTVDAECSQVHFSNKVFGRSIDVDVVGGMAIIPDLLLQTDKDLTAWAFVGTPENGYTKISKVFKVNRRNKPSDYVFTPPDQTTLGEILDRIEDLENRPSGDISEEDIQNAVNDYLDKNPVSMVEKDPTVPAWAKQATKPSYTAAEVGALPADTVIPETPEIPFALPNPHKLTLTGAVSAEYDGSEAVKVEIPAGGGAEWKLVADIIVAEDVARLAITTNTNGKEISELGYSELYIYYLLGQNEEYAERFSNLKICFNKTFGGDGATFEGAGNGSGGRAGSIYAIFPKKTVDTGTQNFGLHGIAFSSISASVSQFSAKPSSGYNSHIASANIETPAGIKSGSRIIVYGR